MLEVSHFFRQGVDNLARDGNHRSHSHRFILITEAKLLNFHQKKAVHTSFFAKITFIHFQNDRFWPFFSNFVPELSMILLYEENYKIVTCLRQYMLGKIERKSIIWGKKYEETTYHHGFASVCCRTESTEYQPHRDYEELVLYL